ncbi:MAG: ABC transporter substrate-binding protein [Acidimicrobiia bacterium]|nr:ABC transporter substrate-binding protein [Acidimicrobiia bacterium]
MDQREDRARDGGRSALRRWGPLALVVVIVAGVTAVAFAGGGDGGDSTVASTSTTEPIDLPEGVVTWSMAEAEGLDVEFPDTCDEETGRIAIPFFFRTECFANVEENGGATARGVTRDSIKVVAWLPAEDDPVRSLLLERIGFKADNEQLKEVYEGFVEVFQRYYQTYGREVELEFLEATGTIFDSAAARADAVRADEEMGAFAVLGGPVIGSAWTDELHARGIVCIACPGITGGEPTVFTLPPSNNQIRSHMANYVSRKLSGSPAEFAGDELQDDERVFGHLALGLSEGDQERAEEFEQRLADLGVDLADQVLYPLDPSRAAELATSGIASMQAAGVTTVIVQADPILLPAFTQEATKQQWFPEWVLAASPFVDTTVFARTFDQEQWEHAFGLSYFPPPVDPEVNPPVRLYEWFHGAPPPVEGTIPLLLLYPQVTLFFTGLEYAGPDLTPETFRDGLFVMPPTPRAVTQPQVNYGEELGEEGIYAGIEDLVEVWWDAEGEGPDESGDDGVGVYRYVNGARRSLAEEWNEEVRVFDPTGAVIGVEDLPEDEVPPDYPSPAG